MNVTIAYVDPRPRPVRSVNIGLTPEEVPLLRGALHMAENYMHRSFRYPREIDVPELGFIRQLMIALEPKP